MQRSPFAPSVTTSAPGAGTLVVEHVDFASAVVGARASAPLKILLPRPRGTSVSACVATFGGGLLAGDVIALDIRVGAFASAVVTTQSSTKVYKSEDAVPSRQTLSASLEDGALLALLPDPVCPFAGSVYRQKQRVDLAPGASLVLVDAFVSGRVARGERYDFASYRSATEIFVEDRLVALDALTLEPTPESSVAERMGRFNALATAILIGPRLTSHIERLLDDVTKMPVRVHGRACQPLLATASPIPGGVMLRVAAERPEDVTTFLRDSLHFIAALLGDQPWARKW